MAGRTIDDCLHALDIGLPGTIGTSVRVGNLDAEGHALIAELAFCHPLHLLALTKVHTYLRKHKIYYQMKIKNASTISEKNEKIVNGGKCCEKDRHTL
jgi:hypothetical protein